jgi:hypothetical protein
VHRGRTSVVAVHEKQGMAAERVRLAESAARAADARELMTIQCERGHHIARILDTTEGTVIETRLNRRSHGRRDLHSDPHGVDHPTLWWDFVTPTDDPAPDDVVPAGCACGDHTLSRARITDWIASGTPRVLV